MSFGNWKEALDGQIEPGWADEIDQFEAQVELRKQGKLDDKAFAETRLRRGVYGQRYDNGERHDGFATRELPYAGHSDQGTRHGLGRARHGAHQDPLRRGLARAARSARRPRRGVLGRDPATSRRARTSSSTYVHIEDTPDLMRRLAAAGITTREACGNSVRNVTACPLSGVCKTEAFDASPYAQALMRFLLGHPDVQDFGRKFKPAFSGCEHEACGLVQLHDAGYISRMKDGKRGFKVVVGGGLGSRAAPGQGAQRVHARRGAADRDPGRLARLRAARREEEPATGRASSSWSPNLGIEEFKRLVEEERKTFPHDPRTHRLRRTICRHYPAGAEKRLSVPREAPNGAARRPRASTSGSRPTSRRSARTATRVVTINLPLGDLTSEQARQLADIAREVRGATTGAHHRRAEHGACVTSPADLPALYTALTPSASRRPAPARSST